MLMSRCVTSCSTSPSAMVEEARDSTPRTSSEPTSTISSKERVNRKSPTSTEALSPHTELAVGLPRRSALTSTTSSCKSVAEWMNSTQVASLICRSSSAA